MQKRVAAFIAAFRGLALLVREEPHARFHLLMAAAVAATGFLVKLDAGEWSLILFAIALVWTAEALNAAIERTVDLVTREKQPLAGAAKDLAAAAVLAASIGAAFIGLLIFLPKILG